MQENKDNEKVIETYAEDMARVLESDQGGLIKKIIHEQELRDAEKKKLSPQSRQNKLYLLFGAALLAAAAALAVFFIRRDANPAVSVEPQFTPLIFNDKSFFIETNELAADKIAQSVLSEGRTTDLKEGGVEGIYFTKNHRLLGLREFLSAIKSGFNPGKSALISDNFLTGFFNAPSGKDFFILLKTRSLSDIFDEVRAWEGKMFHDLHAFFAVPINQNTSYLLTKGFEDTVVENKNARALYDKDGNTVMMYVFADDTSVVIADKIETVREVISRLESAQIKK